MGGNSGVLRIWLTSRTIKFSCLHFLAYVTPKAGSPKTTIFTIVVPEWLPRFRIRISLLSFIFTDAVLSELTLSLILFTLYFARSVVYAQQNCYLALTLDIVGLLQIHLLEWRAGFASSDFWFYNMFIIRISSQNAKPTIMFWK